MSGFENQVLTYLQMLFDRFGWLGVAGLMGFENATSVAPSEVILTLAGWLLLERHGAPVTQVFLLGLVAALGSAVGSSITYWIVRLGGRPLVDKLVRVSRVNPAYITRSEAEFLRWGPGLVAFGRLIPAVRFLVTIPAALVKMPFWRYFLYTLAGAYVWCTVLIGVGYTLGRQLPVLGDRILARSPWLFIPLLATLALFLFYRNFVQRRSLAVVGRRTSDDLPPPP